MLITHTFIDMGEDFPSVNGMVTQKRVLIVIAPARFRDEELSEPIKYLEKAGIEYDIVSTRTGLAVGMLGGKVLVEKTVREIGTTGVSAYTGIMIIGGGGSVEFLWDDMVLREVVREFERQEKIISAICLSTVVLAGAGVLKGIHATVWNDDGAIARVQNGGGIYKADPIVVDGRVITANGPPAAAGFGEKVAKAITSSS